MEENKAESHRAPCQRSPGPGEFQNLVLDPSSTPLKYTPPITCSTTQGTCENERRLRWNKSWPNLFCQYHQTLTSLLPRYNRFSINIFLNEGRNEKWRVWRHLQWLGWQAGENNRLRSLWDVLSRLFWPLNLSIRWFYINVIVFTNHSNQKETNFNSTSQRNGKKNKNSLIMPSTGNLFLRNEVYFLGTFSFLRMMANLRKIHNLL